MTKPAFISGTDGIALDKDSKFKSDYQRRYYCNIRNDWRRYYKSDSISRIERKLVD